MIGLVTYAKVPQLTEDDRPLIAELAALGYESRPVVWDDPDTDWRAYSALVLRSCWDYHLRPAEFREWLATIERLGVPLWNPAQLARWNMHKFYLRDLAAQGVLIPGTRWMSRGSGEALATIMGEEGWADAIVKPAISASATDTWRAGDRRSGDGARFAELVQRSDVLVQEVIPEVAEMGEWSLMFIGEAFSHATLKRPATGDFRVQTEHGGSAEAREAPADIIAAGERVSAHIPRPWLYARIDGVMTARGYMLMEIECLEPVLFFDHAPESRARFAGALVDLLTH